MQPGYLYIPVQEEPVFLAKKNLERAMEESSLTNIVNLSSSKEIPSVLTERDISPPQTLGLEMDVLPAVQLSSTQDHIQKGPHPGCLYLDTQVPYV